MSIIDIIGFIPAIIFPAAALMQLVHLVRAKRSEGVSALSWSAFALGNLAMFVYAEKYFELQAVVGLLGIPLDGPAILVSSVALGVCVDDTIHFFTKFARGRRAGLAPRAALEHVFAEAGAAMTLTTVVLIIGFSTLLLSDFSPNFQMGALAAVMIGLAWVADFVVTAAVLSYSREHSDARAGDPTPHTSEATPPLAAATR